MTTPRYGRTNRRYKVSKPKEKMAPEKKLAVKSILSLTLFAVLWTASCFTTGEKVHKILYTTYSAKDWQRVFVPAVTTVRKTAANILDSYVDFVSKAEKNLGIDEPSEITPSAKADKGEAQELPKAELPPVKTEPKLDWRPPLWSNVTSEFGERIHPITEEKTVHTGVDIAAEEGTPVVAAAQGTVSRIGYDDANGHYVIVDHGEGITTVYAHLKCVYAKEGDAVSPTTGIAEAGSTGISTGPHLHFEIKIDGDSVDPRKYVFFKEG